MSNLGKLLNSIILTIAISFIFALIFSPIFWHVFALATIIQLAVSTIFTQVYRNRVLRDFEIVRIDQIKEENRNFVLVTCPCDEQHKQEIDFRFDQPNVVECDTCNKQFKCEVGIRTALTTEPIYFENGK